MRKLFLAKVAAPIADKLLECGYDPLASIPTAEFRPNETLHQPN
jgi:hypothetical protein